MRSPWLLGAVAWDPVLIRRAVVWLSLLARTAILRLTDSHYADNHLQVSAPQPPISATGTLTRVACAPSASPHCPWGQNDAAAWKHSRWDADAVDSKGESL